MPISILFAALISGALCVSVWLSLGGGALGALLVYWVSGSITMATLLAHLALRDIR